MVNIDEYTREVTCEYKGELYSVRDNGAVLRHAREGKPTRPLDNKWTFGRKNEKGYMMISNHRVHIIVATAFVPGRKEDKVVDHIDTNRCNNRVENLRWLTPLENVLLNEVTLKRVTYLCGGDIKKFIENPSCLQDLTGKNQDIMWMRTVTAEEARLTWERISQWARRPISAYQLPLPKVPTKSFEEWLGNHDIKEVQSNTSECFTNPKVYDFEKEQSASEIISTDHLTSQDEQIEEEDEWDKKEVFFYEKNESLTPCALQKHFYEKMSFPLCPNDTNGGLDAYADKLSIGEIAARTEHGEEFIILSWGWTLKLDAIQVVIQQNELRYYMYISLEGEKYFHFIKYYYEESCRFCGSQNVLQYGGKALCDFPLCPKDGNITLEEYADLLKKDVIFEKNQYGNYCVIDQEIVRNEGEEPYLLVALSAPNEIKPYGDARVYVKNGKVIHKIEKCYFDYNTLQRRFCAIRGQEWTGEDTIDDYC